MTELGKKAGDALLAFGTSKNHQGGINMDMATKVFLAWVVVALVASSVVMFFRIRREPKILDWWEKMSR